LADQNRMSEESKKQERRPVISGFVWLGIGLYLQLMVLDFLPPPDQSWPVIIIIIGVAMIVGAFFRKPKSTVDNHNVGQPHI